MDGLCVFAMNRLHLPVANFSPGQSQDNRPLIKSWIATMLKQMHKQMNQWTWAVLQLCLMMVAPIQAAQVQQGTQGMVVAGHEVAAQAGRSILAQNGNAIDAAVAVATTLNVAEPWGSGIGGKLVMLYYDASLKRVYCVEALDQASQSMSQQTDGRHLAVRKAGVPGMLMGWAKAHEKWGTQSWASLCQPAIDAAEQGVTLDRFDIIAINNAKDKLIAGGAGETYMLQGNVPQSGQTLANPQLASTYRVIQKQGYKAVYGGNLGQKMVDHITKLGGWMTIADLQQYQPRIYTAPHIRYRDTTVYSCNGPATGGPTVLLSLACLNQQQLATDPLSAHASTKWAAFSFRSTASFAPNWLTIPHQVACSIARCSRCRSDCSTKKPRR
jgi:gamma-glutamyltranspeptidase/glutathione hydrolase